MSQHPTVETPIRHFLSVDDLQPEELLAVLDTADEMKAERGSGNVPQPLAGLSVALIFEKPSLRTRVSFEVGVSELGGTPVVLSGSEVGIGARESVSDIARVLSGYVDAIVLRTFAHSRLEELAEAGSVPVINALSDLTHPCQALADLQTIREYKGSLSGLKLAYLGDGNNVAHSLLKAGAMTGMDVSIVTPPGFEPDAQILDEAAELCGDLGGSVGVTNDVGTGVADADVLYTDVWASMGQEDEADQRATQFASLQLNASVLDAARPDAIVMHCLPAHRGEEITEDVLEGQASVVFTQAENRLHAQKALLDLLIRGAR